MPMSCVKNFLLKLYTDNVVTAVFLPYCYRKIIETAPDF